MTTPTTPQPASEADVFFALADNIRRELLLKLVQDGGTSASELARGFPISRQAIGKHLEVLTDAQLVYSYRKGREVRYEPQAHALKETAQWLNTLARQWDRKVKRRAKKAKSDE